MNGSENALKAKIMNETDVRRALARMAHEIIEQNDPLEQVMLVGIRRRGIPLACRLRDLILQYAGIELQTGEVDISMYRDDLTCISEQPRVGSTRFPSTVSGRTVILVDDVLYTGRTARAALEAVMDEGRPACVRLAVLVDRGHRELPIRPDYIGKNIPTSHKERVGVSVQEIDGIDGVSLYSMD